MNIGWKIFKVTYNDGGWHCGDLPHFFYIARSEEEVIANSKRYAEFIERKELRGGYIWIIEFDGINYPAEWENLKDFEIYLSAKHI